MDTYLCHGDAAVKLDQVVEVAKENRDRDEADIARVPEQMRNKLDGLRKDPMRDEEGPEERTLPSFRVRLLVALCRIVPSLRECKVHGGKQGTVEEESPLRKRCLEDGVKGPWVVLWRKD